MQTCWGFNLSSMLAMYLWENGHMSARVTVTGWQFTEHHHIARAHIAGTQLLLAPSCRPFKNSTQFLF